MGWWFAVAFAGPTAERLRQIDEVLAAHGASRSDEIHGIDYCTHVAPRVDEPMDWMSTRGPLCLRTTPVGTWTIDGFVAEGGEVVGGRLSVRQFESDAAAEAARWQTMHFTQVGADWCQAEAVWTGRWLWALEYGCHISVPHVPGIAALKDLLLSFGEPYLGAVGTSARMGGWGFRMDAQGSRHKVPLVAQTWTYASVQGVESDDTLSVRSRPPIRGELGELVGHISWRESCVAVFEEREGWMRVASYGGVGWASGAYLRPTSECPPR